jgi:hypothetical protein
MTHERAQVLVEALQRAVLEGVHEFEGEPERIRVDLGLVPVFADERPLQGLAGLMDWRRSGWLSSLLRSGFCSGRVGERVLMPGGPGLPVDRVVLLGLGPRAEFDAEAAARAARDLVEVALGVGALRVLVALPAHGERRPAELLFAALTEAIEEVEQARERRQPSVVAAEPEPPIPVVPTEAATSPGDEAALEPSALDASDEVQGEGAGSPDATEIAPAKAPEPEPEPELPRIWWVVADERVVARLRRVLSGPPRATPGGLHT